MTYLLVLHWGQVRQEINLTSTGGRLAAGQTDPVAASGTVSPVTSSGASSRVRGRAQTTGNKASGRSSSTARGRGGNG